ncbi:MAG: phosphoglycerate dehydrogenase [Pirellulales bacterium]|nr:phosphoglycerate dehydrogenase [Pirellulales bacterium]
MPRVLVLDPLAQEGLDILQRAPGFEVEVRPGLSGEALRAALAEADGAIVRSGVKITADALRGNRRLRAIVRAGVGTDNIDKQAATRQGIVVMNTPAGNTVSTAEHTIALMLALSRNIAPAYQSLLEGRWERGRYMGTQLADKTLGIIGLGRIGQAVASRARGLEMRVLGYDPFVSRERAQELGVQLVESVEELLPRVDFLTVHTPLTPETRNLIGRRELELLRPGVRLINCARGGIFDEEALVEGLRSGKLGGVALDVFATEPCTSSPLFGMPNVLCTPHLGASTEEAQTQVAAEAAMLLVDFLTTGAVRHAVNMVAIDPQKLEGLRGFLDVGYRLGLLLAQLDRRPARSCRIQYRGEVAGKDTRLITAAIAAGLLAHSLEEEINIVNAELLLRERGIELVEQSRSDMGAFSSLIQAELTTEGATYRAAGTLFGHNMARLVQLDDYRLDAYLDGVLMIFTHRDVPGIIGRVGTLFGEYQVNIAQMAVGRTARGGEAIGVLNLDTRPPEAALQAVLAHPEIHSATVIELPAPGEQPPWLGG